MCTVVNDTAFVYTRDPAGFEVLQHAPSPQLVKLNTDFKFMCFCDFWNQVKAEKTHFVAPKREGDFGQYLVCRTVQGYPTHTSDAGGLFRDQFVRPAKSQGKWYGLHTNQKKDTSDTISSWNTGSSHLNSTYLKIARQARIATNPPLSRPISQESLRKWEKSALKIISDLQSSSWI